LVIEGYASLWGVADLNGDVVQAGAFAESLAKTGAEGVRMLHQHEGRAVVGVSFAISDPAARKEGPDSVNHLKSGGEV
jgi:hypothetical protein